MSTRSSGRLFDKIPLIIALIAPFIALTFLAVGLVGYLSFHNGQKAVNDVAYRLRNEITQRIYDHLHTFLNTPHQINQINAGAMHQGLLDENDPAALERHFWRQVRIFRSVTSVYFGNTRGGLVNSGREGATDSRYVIVTDGFASGPFRKYATDSLGNRTDLLVTVPNFDARTRQWYAGAVEKGRAAWSPVYILFTGQDMAVAASRPVYDGQQKLLGVVSTDIFLSQISHFLQNLSIGETGRAFIVERSGWLIASSTDEKPFTEQEGTEAQRRLHAGESTIPMIMHAAKALNKRLGHHNITDAQHVEFEINGRRQFLQALPVLDEYGLDWLIVVVIPEADFMNQINANNRVTAFFIVLTLAIAVIIGSFAARMITRPISRLQDSSRILAKGEWTKAIRDDSRLGEISALTRSFNRMAGQLQHTLDDLNHEIVERRHAERELQESEEKYRILVENQTDLIVKFDAEGRLLFVSQSYCDTFGKTREQLIGKKFMPLIHEQDRESVSRAISEVYSPPYSSHVEERVMAKDGWRWQAWLNTAVFDDEGEVATIVAVGRDITDRKHAENALTSGKAFLDRVIDQSPLAIWISDAEGTLQRANPALKKFLNLTDEQLVGKYNVLKDPLAEQQGLMPLIRTVYEEGKSVSFACDWDGNDIPTVDLKGSNSVSIEATMFPIHNSENELTNVVLSWIDITKRKQAEEELRQLRNYLSNIINSMPSMLVGVDAKGKVTQWNKTAEQTTGIPADVAQGRTLSDVFPRMSSEMKKIAESIRTREIRQERKMPCVSADGETRYEDVTIYPLIANGVEGAVIRIDDVTDKVRMEEMMIQSEKMLSVGGLAAGMAHEINNPLAGLMQTANVMANRLGEKTNMPANLRAAEAAGTTMEAIRNFMEARGIPRMLSTISESGRRVAAIVDNMLSFARKSDTRVSSHDMADLLDRTLELAATDYDLKKKHDFRMIGIRREYEKNLPSVPCEGAKMQQVLLNILRNGAQAMQEPLGKDENNPHFILRLAKETETGMLRIEIGDNGPGMNEATRKRIFEPFFTTKPVGEGTGLGLSVSYFIITENHGGTMNVSSEPGKGATFIIRLPMEGKGGNENHE